WLGWFGRLRTWLLLHSGLSSVCRDLSFAPRFPRRAKGALPENRGVSSSGSLLLWTWNEREGCGGDAPRRLKTGLAQSPPSWDWGARRARAGVAGGCRAGCLGGWGGFSRRPGIKGVPDRMAGDATIAVCCCREFSPKRAMAPSAFRIRFPVPQAVERRDRLVAADLPGKENPSLIS